MERIPFQDIPEEYEEMKNQIFKKTLDIVPLYSKFKFSYINLSIYNETNANNSNFNNPKQEENDILYSYLKRYRFIVYHIPDLKKINDNDTKNLAKCAIICVEEICLIIEFDSLSIVLETIDKLKKKGNVCISTKESDDIIEEINSYYYYFINKIKNNIFVKATIKPMSLFIIRRFFYPTDYFRDPSFFIFDLNKKSKEQEMKEILVNISESHNLTETDYDQVSAINKLAKFKYRRNENFNFKFNANDFIILRIINSKDGAFFKLVIHIKKLHVFMMKEIFKEFEHEDNFVRHYSHHCITKFYGFVTKNSKTVGYIYEFLSNGTLNSLIKHHSSQINENFILLTIIRLCQAIEYLHSNSLIHRDIKTDNIILDHDFIPYLSDFDTIRDLTDDEIITMDFGSEKFMSPEQFKGDPISYSSDIYSFGIVIKTLLKQCQNEIFVNGGIAKLCSQIYKSCVKDSPDERITIVNIKIIIKNYINSIDFSYLYEIYLLNKMNVINFTLEFISLNEDDCENKFIYRAIQNFNSFYSFLLNNPSESDQANEIGNMFFQNNDYLKAKKYYKMSADMKNSDGQVNYGILYYYGKGVKQDFLEAKKYFELAADQNNISAYNYLGNLYENGLGVQKNYFKAEKYYQLSAKQKDQHGLTYLGNIYFNGYVGKDYLKAKYCFELAAAQNNLDANYYLGKMYYYGFGVRIDYKKAIEYLEIVSHINSYASRLLGKIYFQGKGAQPDYMKAKHYFELSASLNDSEAMVKLGKMYLEGKGVEKNLLKAKEYYELAIKYKNPNAMYFLSQFYSTEDSLGIDVSKSINCLLKCIQIHFEKHNLFRPLTKNYFCTFLYNKYFYHSNNDLGLIYLIEFQDIEKADKYIKEAAYGEYPFGQNNLGLLNYFYYHNLFHAKYMFQKASKQKFAIAEYNLGFLYEQSNIIEESIEMYKKASNDEDEPFIFRNKSYEDKRLNISKAFIICFTDLKLTFYYLSVSDYQESKKYFIKSFSKFFMNEKSEYYKNEVFTYFKEFICELPLFKMIEQQNFEKNNNQEKIDQFYIKEKEVFMPQPKNNFIYNNNDKKHDLEQFFEFAISNYKEFFITSIKQILQEMDKKLYTPPFRILFGRINIIKPKKQENEIKGINECFYDGFFE